MATSSNYSISKRLTMMNMLVSGAALLLACIVLLAYDSISFREGMARQLSIQAQIIGSNSLAALAFSDAPAAEQTLAALKASTDIASAVIVTPDGEVFAAYTRNQSDSRPAILPVPAGQAEVRFSAYNRIGLAHVISSNGKIVGTVYLESDLSELDARLRGYLLMVGAVLVFSMLAALVVSTVARNAISEPIVRLAYVAREVSRQRNFSVRAAPTKGGGELTLLTEAFNEMLEQIQERDAALQKGKEELERRVEQRTAQLAAANKELEAFSYSVSHDLRAPLRHIDGFSSLLVEKYGKTLDPMAQRYLSYVREGAQNMGRLVDDLLNMGRITRQQMVRVPTDLNAIVQTSLRELQEELRGRDIEWHIDTLPQVECDPGLIKVVFTNLLSNAVKYTQKKEHAVIEVGVTERDGIRGVFVRDNGAGFDQQYSHKLFGVFQRLHRAEEFEGTGVGLATVHRIVNRHGGQIWAEGKVDEGAAFFFTLSSN